MGKKALTSASIEVDTILSHQDVRRNADFTFVPATNNLLELYKLRTELSDRDYCEKDLSRLQYLVYMRVSFERPSVTIEGGVDQFVFLYQRGVAGGEDRLHDLWSIGLGGHVEDAPTVDMSLLEILAESALRELDEEIHIELDISVFKRALMAPVLMRDTREVREAVHLGLFIDVRVDESQISNVHETNVINNGAWVLLRDIQARHAAGELKLEPWSAAFVGIPLPAASHFADQAS